MRRCPICGAEPKLESRDLGRPNGRGYPGETDYSLKCPDCGMVKVSADTIYDDTDDGRKPAPERVYDWWNEACLKVEAHLKWREEKESINPFVKDLLLAMVEGENVNLTDTLRAKLIKEVENL